MSSTAAQRSPALPVAFACTAFVAGLALYGLFVAHVLSLGAAIVEQPIESAEASGPVAAGAAGTILLLLSGCAALHPALRDQRLAPLAGLGWPLALGAIAGAAVFKVGAAAFFLSAALALPGFVTAALATTVPPAPRPGLARFLARSWMTTGTVAGFALAAAVGLQPLEQALPHIPWASVVFGLILLTLLQSAARYVARHGGEPSGLARDHQQVRHPHETDAIRAVAEPLHAYIEEGRAPDDYVRLAERLDGGRGHAIPTPPPSDSGRPALPVSLAALVATLQAAALAVPALLLPTLGPGLGLLLFGLALPFARSNLAPRQEPASRAAWFASAVTMALGGALLVIALAPHGSTMGLLLGAPSLFLTLAMLRRRRRPDNLAALRRAHAELLAQRSRRQVRAGLVVAASAAAAPVAQLLARLLLGLESPAIPVEGLAVVALSGLLFSLAALASGPAARRHRAAAQAAQEEQVAQRRNAHLTFLENLELT
ncbi:MAG: hypothetical protein AABX89_00170 [Candidatus Thermoplasmatota archaeon]